MSPGQLLQQGVVEQLLSSLITRFNFFMQICFCHHYELEIDFKFKKLIRY